MAISPDLNWITILSINIVIIGIETKYRDIGSDLARFSTA